MRNMSREEFAKILSESCVSVWVDRISGFGTFPMESMLCKTPVIGSLPILKPDWLTQDNGLWTMDESKLVEVLGNYIKTWLEGSVPVELYAKMEETVSVFSEDKERDSLVSYFKTLFDEKTQEFKNSINKLTPVGANA
jgi:glycosyltransferase involved in cell wall biosynthesis